MKFFSPALRFYFKDKLNLFSYLAVLVLMVASFLSSYFLIPSNDNTPLHYNVYFGIDYVGDSVLVYLIPLVVLFLSILNIAVGLMVWRHDRVLGYFMSMGTLCIAIIGAVAIALIINLVR